MAEQEDSLKFEIEVHEKKVKLQANLQGNKGPQPPLSSHPHQATAITEATKDCN